MVADNLNDFKAKQYIIVISLFSSVKNKKQKTFELSYQKVTLQEIRSLKILNRKQVIFNWPCFDVLRKHTRRF